ncbi:MAG: response regulator [Gallionellaceae bacterium]
MTERILIVDDDEFIRSILKEVLELAGYLVEAAEDGLDAWEQIDSAPSLFDLILLDKKMSRLDGIGLLKRIKSDERFKELPVIMLTGDNQQQDIVEGLAEGAYYYLTKPATEAVLKRVIKNALEEFRKKRELLEMLGHQTNTLHILRRAEFSFQTLQEARDLALLLADASLDPARTVNGYSELLINAIEHGNLGITYAEKSQLMSDGNWQDEIEARLQCSPYSERMVNVSMQRTASAYIVTIADQGGGFDWQSYIDFSPERVFDLHGRGIAMSKVMSFDDVEFVGNGNTVVATVVSS